MEVEILMTEEEARTRALASLAETHANRLKALRDEAHKQVVVVSEPMRCAYHGRDSVPAAAWYEWRTSYGKNGAPVCTGCLSEKWRPDNFGEWPTVRVIVVRCG